MVLSGVRELVYPGRAVGQLPSGSPDTRCGADAHDGSGPDDQHPERIPYEGGAGSRDGEHSEGNLTLPEAIYETYNTLLENGWKKQDIDGMDMLGYLKVRAWKAGKEKSHTPTPIYR